MPPRSVTRKTPMPGRPQLTVQEQRRLLSLRASEFALQTLFKYGYRNKEDPSNLPPNTMVIGSQNILTNAAELVGVRQGYVLDGSAGTQNDYGIDSAYDFQTRTGIYQNLAKWGPNLEVRYANPVTSAVTWVNILKTLNPTKPMNFAPFWDQNTELKEFCLGVNGDNKVYEWSGAVGSFASATANTITLQGTVTTSRLGFYDNAANATKFKLLDQNGNVYTYTGVSGETFTGVTPTPIGAFVVGDPVIQQPNSITGANIVTTGPGTLGTSFEFDLIASLENQVWYGSFLENGLRVSKTNVYTDVSFNIPRLPADGALIVLDAPPVALKSEAAQMYAGAGTDQWWFSSKNSTTLDVAGSAVQYETLLMSRIKTTFNQAPQSQALVTHFKNSLLFVSNEVIINSLGLVKDVYVEPQFVNLSDPIKNDVDAYDFTGGAIDYDNYYIYTTIPRNNVMRMYNVQKNYWEAPQTIPVSRFYRVRTGSKTTLYGHSSLTNEHYQLFTGYNDNGNPINVVAAFPYVANQGGSANMKKDFNKLYMEGYIASNTTLTVSINYDFGGYSGTYTTIVEGNDSSILFNKITDGSLGQNSLGSQPIGTILNLPSGAIVPKFRQISTMPRVDFFDYQIVFSSNDVDQNWTLLRFGPAIGGSQALPVSITK